MAPPEKRFQVFVSSTYQDLGDERQEVIQALLELDCIPAGMELFPAANDDQWTLIKRVIDDCDYYIVIVGGRYGSIGPDGKSYTQMEYEYALSEGKPIIGFLHKEPADLPLSRSEADPVAAERLAVFRELVQQKMCRYWTTPSELGSVVSRSVIKLIKSTPAIGWVRGDQVPDVATTEELLRLRAQVDELEREQQAAAVTEQPANATDLAQGEEEVALGFSFDHTADGSYVRSTGRWSFKTSWNQVFARISPLMIDRAPDSSIKAALNEFVASENRARMKGLEEMKGRQVSRFALGDDDFLAIMVQFRALGLVEKVTVARRGVYDKDTYWTLTPYGDRVMTQLRAIRKGAPSS